MYVLGNGVLMSVVWLISPLDVNHRCRVVFAIYHLGVAAQAALQLGIRLHLFNRLRCATSLQFTYLPVLSWVDSYVRVFFYVDVLTTVNVFFKMTSREEHVPVDDHTIWSIYD